MRPDEMKRCEATLLPFPGVEVRCSLPDGHEGGHRAHLPKDDTIDHFIGKAETSAEQEQAEESDT